MKRFEGWEPVTAYTYDGDRLVSSVPEAEWDDEQQGWTLALALHRASRCPHCGGDIEECGPQSAGKWTVPVPRRCHRTDALLIAQEGSKRLRPDALLWRVERR